MKNKLLILLLTSAICMSGCAGKAETTGTSAFTEASAESTTIATEVTTSEGTTTESATTSETEATDSETSAETAKEKTMVLKIGDTKVPVTWEDNDSVSDLKALAKDSLTIEMSMYGGFEQVGPIGKSITRNDAQTTTSSGDIVLYSGDQIVIFYGSNSWSYTRLGRIDLSEDEMKALLSNGDVTITLCME